MKRIAALLIIGMLFIHGKVQASVTALTASNDEPVMDFPNSITFKADLSSTTSIQKVKLHYGSLQDTCGNVSSVAYPEITPGPSVSAQWEWDMRQSGGEPPGTTIWWQWEVVDDQGVSQMTEKKEIIWLDSIHAWQEIDKGQIRLHYYYDDQSYGQTLADAADGALARLSQDIGMVAEEPIDLYIYENTDDMREAVFYEPGWTGGQAYSSYNILIIGIDPFNLDWGKSTEAHELTHVLAGDYMFTCLGSSPTWLDEGLAVYGEGGPNSTEAAAFEQSAADDSLLSFAVLSGGFSEDPDVADLSYTQSYYMVNYLIQTYGKEKMLALLGELRTGEEINEALLASYGFDLSAFENEWRLSLGLSAVSTGAADSTPIPTVIPTIIPIQGLESWEVTVDQPVVSPTPQAASTFVSEVPEITQNSPLQQIKNRLGSNLILIISFIAASCIFLVIVLLIVNRKGGSQ